MVSSAAQGTEAQVGAMERLTITVPAAMAADLHERVEAGDYPSASEIVREALEDWTRAQAEDQFDLEDLRKLARQGMESGPGIPADEAFAEIYAMIDAMHDRR